MRLPVTPVLTATLLLAGCSFGESGVSPPLDQIFLPGGMAADPAGRFLFVINSNSDLRYNAGTLVSLDLESAAADRAPRTPDWPACPSPGYVAPKSDPARACCRDYFDRETLNCDERGYIDARRTIQLGSFGSTLLVDQPDPMSTSRRLYMAVRAEPSVTFVDATVDGGEVNLRCAAGEPGQNHLCDNSYKVLGENDPQRGPRLAEEPHNLAIDPKLRLLYVSHAAESVSVVDLCPEVPSLVSVRTPVFDVPGEWVTSILPSDPGNTSAEIFATGRNFINAGLRNAAAQIRSLYLRGAEMGCNGVARKEISVVPGEGFFSSAFFSSGIDIRGLLLSPDRQRAFVLHRNALGRDNPPALVVVDRSVDSSGKPSNRAVGVVEICSGATRLRWHDSGRGPQIFVVCFEAGQVYVIDPDRLTVTAVINTGRGPNEIIFAPKVSRPGEEVDPRLAYVLGFADNNVSIVDLQPGSRTEYKVIQRLGFPHVGAR